MGNLCCEQSPETNQAAENGSIQHYRELEQKITTMQRKIEEQQVQIKNHLLDRQKLDDCKINIDYLDSQMQLMSAIFPEEKMEKMESNYAEALLKIVSAETCIKNVRSYIVEWEKRMLATTQINKSQAEKLENMQDKLTSLEVLCSKQEFMEKCLDYYGSIQQKVEELEKMIQESSTQDIQSRCDVLYDNYLILYEKLHKFEKVFEGTSIQELFDILKENYMILEKRICEIERENWKEKYEALNEKYIGLQRRVQYLGQLSRRKYSDSRRKQNKSVIKREKEVEEQCWTSVESLPTLVIEAKK